MRKTRREAAVRKSLASSRSLAPPELRYQFLREGPGRSPWAVRGFSTGVGVVAGGVMMFVLNHKGGLLVAPVVAAVVNALAHGVGRLLGPSKDYRALPVAIVPWGIILDPDGAPTALGWPAIRELSFTRVDRDGNRDGGAPAIAIMLFDTEAGVVQAQAEDGEWVTSIDAFAPRFAQAASKGPAADLAGETALETEGIPPSLALLRRAEAILDSADGRATLGMESGTYRTVSSRTPTPETKNILRTILWNASADFDPGPLAAVLIAELGIAELLPDLLRMILATSPLLAAVSRAAAQRLGAGRVQTGSLDELRLYLDPKDLAELERWSVPPASPKKNPFQNTG